MADQTKKLLVRLTLDNKDFAKTLSQIRQDLKSMNSEAQQNAAASLTAAKSQLAATKQEIADQQVLVNQSKALEAFDRAKAAFQRQQQEVIKTKVQSLALETAEVKKQTTAGELNLKLEKQRLQIQQQQLRMIQQQNREHGKQSKESGGAGILGTLGGLTSKLVGGGLLGAVTGGVLAGEGISEALNIIVERFRELGKSITEATGPAQTLRAEFERLAQARGSDPSDMLNKLRQSTRGLVADVSLFRMANNFLKSDLQVSTEQMSKLIENTVNLGRSMGRSSEQITSALEMAFLNPQRGLMRLARVTGISVENLRQGFAGLPRSVDPATRALVMFNTVMEQEEIMLKKVGVPITTLPELMTQVSNAYKNFIDGVAEGLLKSGAFGSTIKDISKWLTDMVPKIQEAGVWIGDKLGGALEVGKFAVSAFVAELRLLVNFFELFFSSARAFTLGPMSEQFKHSTTAVSAFRTEVGKLATAFENMSYGLNKASIMMKLFSSAISDSANRDKFQKDIDDASDALAKLNHEHSKSIKGIQTYVFGDNKDDKAGLMPKTPQHDSMGLRNKLIDQEKKLEELEHKITMERFKQTMTEQEEMLKDSYERRLMSLRDYLNAQEVFHKQELAMQLGEIERDRQSQLKALHEKGTATIAGQTITVTPGKETAKAEQLINAEAESKRIAAVSSTEKQIAALRVQGRNDELKAEEEQIKKLNDIQRIGVEEQRALLEKQYSQGRIDAETYLAEKRNLINEEYLIVDEGLRKQADSAKLNLASTEAFDKQRVELKAKTEKELAIFDEGQNDVRLKYMEKQFSTQEGMLKAQAQSAQTRGQSGLELRINEELLQATNRYIEQLKVALSVQDQTTEQWQHTVEQIEQAIDKAARLNQEIRHAANPATALGGIAGGLSGIAGAIPKSTGAAAVSETLSNIQQGLQDTSVFTEANKASKDAGGPGVVGELSDSFKALITHTGDLAANFKQFGSSMMSIISGIQGVVKGVTSGKTGFQGAVSGASAGANFGSAFGPIGMAIGGAAGGIAGGIFGSKQKQLMQDIHKVTDQMQSIVDSMQEGAISLGQAIQDLRKERQAALQILSQDPAGKKGGGKGGKKGFQPSEAQAVINQIDAQIGQLVNEQKQLLDQLNQQVALLSSPAPFQQYVSSLDQIIQKYQQFASAAAGNAQEVGNAQTFLNESLQQYVTTLSQQLNQAQQTAIQDSLTLLNLEYQRQQIINQEAQQEYDILTQGVLTRQRTTAMTKGQQIGQLRYQRDMQLQQIDEQIALQQYKVQTEQQIFDLATTRIGLETQLLSLQEDQAGYQNQQTAALLQVVQQLQGAMANGTLQSSIAALGAGGVMPTGTGLLTTLLGELGLGGYVPTSVMTGTGGATNYLSQIPQQYQSITNFVNNLDPNFLQNLWSAMQTPAGSSQRSSAASEAAQFADDANTSGYDMNSFVSWIKSGSQIAASTASITNAPVGTGPQSLPPGTTFAMPTSPGYSPSSVPQYPTSGSAPYDAVSSSMTTLNTSTQDVSTAMQNLSTIITGINQGYTTAQTGAQGTSDAVKASSSFFSSLAMPSGTTPNATLANSSFLTSASSTSDRASYDLTMKKATTEMTVISARHDLLSAEMQHIAAYNNVLDRISAIQGNGGAAGSLEGMFQQLYETRGRYGSGTFRRTSL